jgi:hypothetical protein
MHESIVAKHAASLIRRAGIAPALGVALLVAGGVPAASADTPAAGLPPMSEDVVQAHLERGLFYMDQGEYARAVLEFEQVMKLTLLSVDARERAEAYARAARRYQRGEQVSFASFAQTGLGYYRENTTDSTRAAGGDPARDPFVLARVNTGVTYVPDGDLSISGSLDYRFRYYDADGRRNDSDLRWNGTLSHALEKGSVAGGARGRVSYRGDATYRNDVGVFVNRDYLLDSDNSILVEFDVRRRQYQSRLAERNRTNAEVGVTWTRAEQDGRGSLSVNVMAGYEWRRDSAPDGDATLYGGSVDWSKDLSDSASVFLFGWYEHNGFHDDRVLFDETEAPVGAKTRADDLFEFGGGLVYRLVDGWTLRPEILYVRDESNALWGNYSSTEAWVAVRRAF